MPIPTRPAYRLVAVDLVDHEVQLVLESDLFDDVRLDAGQVTRVNSNQANFVDIEQLDLSWAIMLAAGHRLERTVWAFSERVWQSPTFVLNRAQPELPDGLKRVLVYRSGRLEVM